MQICLGRICPRVVPLVEPGAVSTSCKSLTVSAAAASNWRSSVSATAVSSWRLLMIDATGWYAFANLTSRALAQACTEVDHTSRREVVSMAQYPDVALDDPGARCCLG